MFWRHTSTKIINDVVQTGFGPGGALIQSQLPMFHRQSLARQDPVPRSRSLPYRILLFQLNAGFSINVSIGNCSILHHFVFIFLQFHSSVGNNQRGYS
jgi:hypothetical protein